VKGAVSVLLLFLPSLACAEGNTNQEFSFLSSLLQMFAALAIVIGLILIARHFSGKFFKSFPTGRFVSKHIRLVETRYIAPKKSLILVEVGGEYLLLSSSGDNLTLIKHIDMLEEIEVIEEPNEVRSGFLGLFSRTNVFR
jgi:flagellar protein FliO/FliZ